ncbi:hypothetical protein vseg_018707 [Gypsophila vaccaria]
MSNHVSKASLDEEATSRSSSQACQPSWMSQWTRKNSEIALIVNESALVRNKGKLVDLGGKSDASPSTLNMANGFSKYGKGVIKESKEMSFGTLVEAKKQAYFKCETNDPDFGTKNLSLALALGRGQTSTDLNLGNQSILRSKDKHCVSNPFEEKKGLTFGLPPHGSKKADTSRPVVVFEKHFSNDNFTCFGKESCKYQKYSSLLLHETDMKNDLDFEMGQNLQNGQSETKNFQSFFGKKQPASVPSHRLLPTYPSQSNIDHGKTRLADNVSLRNVETMRICTMVDCVENSNGGYHKISQRAHHVLFTKETCASLPAHGIAPTRPSGVKIQPLWTSTDSEEKENTGNSSVFKASSKNEASVEADSMQAMAPQSIPNLTGRTSSASHKDNTVYETSSLAACDSKTEKTRTETPLLEIPDMNVELPGLQPAVSTTDDDEPSTSRVHSLNAKHLFTNKQRALSDEDHSVNPEASNKCSEPGNRWIKRLKLNSSDSVGVGTRSSDGIESSRQKFNMFFNRIMKSNKESVDPELLKHHGQEQKEPRQDLESSVSKMDNSMINGCSWIQRWCQNTTVSQPKNPEPLVICEPHSLKFSQDEAAKKQFPSIGALALMGKAMNGYRSCEFSKRGSVVVWNTREF